MKYILEIDAAKGRKKVFYPKNSYTIDETIFNVSLPKPHFSFYKGNKLNEVVDTYLAWSNRAVHGSTYWGPDRREALL